MKFIDQKRVHIPADTAFVKRKFLDIRYAPEGDWMLPTFFTPDGKWKIEEDKDDSASNYPGMKFAEVEIKSDGPTEAMKIAEIVKDIESIRTDKAVPSVGDVKDQSLSPFPAEGQRRLLDIYLPNEGEGPYPVIIDVFGGGWYFGRKSSHKLEPALNLLKRGFAVVSINYSLSFQAEFPIQVQEVKAATRFIRKHAAEYDLDPCRIAYLGESAGAHLTSLAATSSASGKLKDSRWPNQDVSDEVQAVINLYCPADNGLLKYLFAVQKQIGLPDTILSEYGTPKSMESVLYGGLISERPWMSELGNPENYLNEKCPPYLFLHGTQDQVVAVSNAIHYAAMIMQHTSIENVTFRMVEGGHHDIHDFEKEWIYDLEAEFLKEKMK